MPDALLLQAPLLSKDQAATELQQATTEAGIAGLDFRTATATLQRCRLLTEQLQTTSKTASEEEVVTTQSALTETSNSVRKVSAISFSQVEELLNKEPEPEPVPEEGSKEIPKDLSAENSWKLTSQL